MVLFGIEFEIFNACGSHVGAGASIRGQARLLAIESAVRVTDSQFDSAEACDGGEGVEGFATLPTE